MALKPFKVWTKYFQKSKYFLYPITGLKRTDNFKVIDTYLAWPEAEIDVNDCCLIALFRYHDSQGYKNFESQRILVNPYFKEVIDCEDGFVAYVFSFQEQPILEDYCNFVLGRYSELSPALKASILKYASDNRKDQDYMQIFLNPQKYYGDYARELILREEDYDDMLLAIQECGQLCDKFDLEKETLRIKINAHKNITYGE